MRGERGSVVVLLLGRERVTEVAQALADAFADYPVMRYVLGAGVSEADYRARLTKLVGFFVMARVLKGEAVLAVETADGSLKAAALVSFPSDDARVTPELEALREEVWATVGLAARARYEAFAGAAGPLPIDAPHIHLNMLGVVNAHRGRGLAGLLLHRVHEMSAARPGSRGVSLTTENADNVLFYQRFGYRVVGHSRVAPGLESWGMFRADGQGAAAERAPAQTGWA